MTLGVKRKNQNAKGLKLKYEKTEGQHCTMTPMKQCSKFNLHGYSVGPKTFRGTHTGLGITT